MSVIERSLTSQSGKIEKHKICGSDTGKNFFYIKMNL